MKFNLLKLLSYPQLAGLVVMLNFKLDPNGKAVDAGANIPNVNDYFSGKAPDLGALEVGSSAVIYEHADLIQVKSSIADQVIK